MSWIEASMLFKRYNRRIYTVHKVHEYMRPPRIMPSGNFACIALAYRQVAAVLTPGLAKQIQGERGLFIIGDAQEGVQVGIRVLGVCFRCGTCQRGSGDGEREGEGTSSGRWLRLLWCVCPCPLGLCLLDQRFLVLPVSLLGLQLLARRNRELVVEAVEEAGGQGAPSEDLR